MKPNNDRIEKTLFPLTTIQDGRQCIKKESIDKAIELVTKKYSNCFCEVSPHPMFPVFAFKVSSGKLIYFEAVII